MAASKYTYCFTKVGGSSGLPTVLEAAPRVVRAKFIAFFGSTSIFQENGASLDTALFGLEADAAFARTLAGLVEAYNTDVVPALVAEAVAALQAGGGFKAFAIPDGSMEKLVRSLPRWLQAYVYVTWTPGCEEHVGYHFTPDPATRLQKLETYPAKEILGILAAHAK